MPRGGRRGVLAPAAALREQRVHEALEHAPHDRRVARPRELRDEGLEPQREHGRARAGLGAAAAVVLAVLVRFVGAVGAGDAEGLEQHVREVEPRPVRRWRTSSRRARRRAPRTRRPPTRARA